MGRGQVRFGYSVFRAVFKGRQDEPAWAIEPHSVVGVSACGAWSRMAALAERTGDRHLSYERLTSASHPVATVVAQETQGHGSISGG